MKKFIKVLGASTLLFAFALTASAASITHLTFDGTNQTTFQGTNDESTTAKFRVVVGPGETVEYFQTNVAGAVQPPVCESVGDSLGLQQGTHFIDRELTLPPNTGTYTVKATAHGIFGGFSADDCVGDLVGTKTFPAALKVVGSSSGSGVGSSDDGEVSFLQAKINELTALIASLTAQVTAITNPPAPEVSSFCSALPGALMTANYGQNSFSNTALQQMLVSNGFSIPALAMGAPYGYYGPQTAGAVGAAQASCK